MFIQCHYNLNSWSYLIIFINDSMEFWKNKVELNKNDLRLHVLVILKKYIFTKVFIQIFVSQEFIPTFCQNYSFDIPSLSFEEACFKSKLLF